MSHYSERHSFGAEVLVVADKQRNPEHGPVHRARELAQGGGNPALRNGAHALAKTSAQGADHR
jgi:hypothetical protein